MVSERGKEGGRKGGEGGREGSLVSHMRGVKGCSLFYLPDSFFLSFFP